MTFYYNRISVTEGITTETDERLDSFINENI